MTAIQSILPLALAAEPASILYIVTGAVGFAYAGLRKSKSVKKSATTLMLICDRDSQAKLNDLKLL
jgi:hypothetical protein